MTLNLRQSRFRRPRIQLYISERVFGSKCNMRRRSYPPAMITASLPGGFYLERFQTFGGDRPFSASTNTLICSL